MRIWGSFIPNSQASGLHARTHGHRSLLPPVLGRKQSHAHSVQEEETQGLEFRPTYADVSTEGLFISLRCPSLT